MHEYALQRAEGRTNSAIGFDLRPDLVVKPGLFAQVLEKLKPLHDLRWRIDRRISSVFRVKQFPSGFVNGPSSQIDHVLRGHLRLQNVVDELLRQITMRRLRWNAKIVDPH